MIIYVEENYFASKVVKRGFMSEGMYAKLYYPCALELLKRDGKHADAIGQGAWMYSEVITRTPCPEEVMLMLSTHPEITC